MENKKICAFDFDGTIVTNEFPKIGQPIQEVIDLIHEVKKQGHYIILYTMREDERLREALDFCRSYRIFFDAVNDNLPHMKEFYKNNPRKIFANYYIDDHNMGVRAVNEDYAMLEQQLKAKDKALDRAIDVICEIEPIFRKHFYTNQECASKEKWKEYFENGID